MLSYDCVLTFSTEVERIWKRRFTGATLLYLPPHSPDPGPIELAFSKLKRLLRAAAERTTEGLWRTIGALLGRFGPDECAAYFRHCGYAQSP